MFGDERGGNKNVKFGFKDMNNETAAAEYAKEVEKVIHDLNLKYVRAKLPELSRAQATEIVDRVAAGGEGADGVEAEELLRLPSVKFFRRRGLHAYRPYDLDGEPVNEIGRYKRLIEDNLPGTYPAGRDFGHYFELMEQIDRGEITPEQAVPKMPNLSRVGGVCPCSRAVRWIDSNGEGGGNGNQA
jgi:hypothetical protein